MLSDSLHEQVKSLAHSLYPGKENKQSMVIDWLMEISTAIEGKDLLIIYSPGGWGNADIANLIDWERSIIDGIEDTLDGSGIRWTLAQYFRTENKFWLEFKLLPSQVWFGLTGRMNLARLFSEQLRFLLIRNPGLKIILVGASMGAAFDNTVMKLLKNDYNIFSIELGTVFFYLPHRAVSEKTLVIDSNGHRPDPVVHWDIVKAAKAYFTAPYRWVKYWIQKNPQKFTYCINVPGHEYRWEFPAVGERIREFLKLSLKIEALNSKLKANKVKEVL